MESTNQNRGSRDFRRGRERQQWDQDVEKIGRDLSESADELRSLVEEVESSESGQHVKQESIEAARKALLFVKDAQIELLNATRLQLTQQRQAA